MELIIDQEFKDLIPPLGSEELDQLTENLLADGCRDPLVAWKVMPEECEDCEGTEFEVLTWRDDISDSDEWFCASCENAMHLVDYILVDGHNRYEICQREDIPFDVTYKFFTDRSQALLWIIDNQFGRRNIADIDRIALARRKEELLRPLAKENQKVALTGPRSERSGKTAETSIDTRKQSAKTAGVGERTYDAGKLILDAAERGEVSKEDIEAIRRKEKSIHRVAKDVKESRQKAKRDTQRKEAVEKVEPVLFDNVHVGDFRDQFDKVADGSLSLIFTDPPYDRKAAELFDELGRFANEKLSDGGSLMTYIGHIQMAEAMAGLSKHLRYWWVCCCLHSGSEALMSEYGIRVGWKPMLWFVKGTRDDKQRIVHDVVSGGKEKTHHDWQQSQSEAEYWVDQLCPHDGIVCDPFLGGGTTAVAAITLNRKWIGFEKDSDQAILAMSRINELAVTV